MNRVYAFFLIIICAMLCGCQMLKSTDAGAINQDVEASVDNSAKDEELQAFDTAVVIDINTADKTVILQTADNGLRYQLTYDGKTDFSDKYGEIMTAAQIEPGDIVDVSLSIHSKTLISMRESSDVFTVRNQESHNIEVNRGVFSVGGESYKLAENLVVVMDGQVGTVSDIVGNDVITVRGINRQILSATIERGHGYLRLKGEESFIGGWLEVGDIIKPVTDNMLVLVPEGDYDIRISYHGRGGFKPAHIVRDEETVVDISDLRDEILQFGKIQFDIDPENATLKLNDEETEWRIPIELEYGVYRIDVSCDGYKSVKSYLSVGKESATVEITLESEEGSNGKDSDASSSTNSQNSVEPGVINSSSVSYNIVWPVTSSSSTVSGNNDVNNDTPALTAKLYINEPEDVEVYFDGSYKGITPLSFTKISGTHVITLRKEGYVTKSYTLTLGVGNDDEEYNFTELKEE